MILFNLKCFCMRALYLAKAKIRFEVAEVLVILNLISHFTLYPKTSFIMSDNESQVSHQSFMTSVTDNTDITHVSSINNGRGPPMIQMGIQSFFCLFISVFIAHFLFVLKFGMLYPVFDMSLWLSFFLVCVLLATVY